MNYKTGMSFEITIGFQKYHSTQIYTSEDSKIVELNFNGIFSLEMIKETCELNGKGENLNHHTILKEEMPPMKLVIIPVKDKYEPGMSFNLVIGPDEEYLSTEIESELGGKTLKVAFNKYYQVQVNVSDCTLTGLALNGWGLQVPPALVRNFKLIPLVRRKK